MINKKIQMAGNTGQTVGTVSASDHLERVRFISGSLGNDLIRGLILFFICVVAVGWFKTINVQKEYAIQELRTEVISLTRENEVSRLEIARLDSPVCIQKIAETKLGMSVPTVAVYGRNDKR